MAEGYKAARAGKLKLKGKKLPSAKKRQAAAAQSSSETPSASKKSKPDDYEHGGWWEVLVDEELRGGEQLVVEIGAGCYLASMDNGKFTVGPPHAAGEPPHPEEILHIIRTPDCKWVSLRTGFGKYVGVDSGGAVVGTAEAVGGREKWEAVFHEGKTAMQALGNSCFLSCVTDKEGLVYASTKAAKETEMIKLRMCAERKVAEDWRPSEDKMGSLDCELAYRKKFQHTKIPLSVEERGKIKIAKTEGNLHESLLDRRMKMKSDKYC